MSKNSSGISQVFTRLFNIEKGEKKDVLLLLCFSFLTGVSFVFYSTATVSVFISTFKADMLPYAFIASGIIGYILWYLFARVQQYLSFSNLLFYGYLFLLVSIVFLFFMSEQTGNKWWYFSMFVWMRFFTFLNAVMFGGLFARVFNMQQGKRLFAFISAGDVVSQMMGYFSIPILLKSTGVSGLLLICISGIVLQLILILFMRKYYSSRLGPVSMVKAATSTTSEDRGKDTRQYYQWIFLVSLLPMLGFYYVDYMFLNELKLEYTTGQAVAGFLGLFLGGVAIVELITRLFISGRLLTMYGLKFGINILPLALLLSTLIILFFALTPGFAGLVFSMIAFSKLLERVLRFSFNEPAFQIFYQPIPPERRFSFRTKMEGVPKALGVVIAGALILCFNLLGFKASLYLNLLFLVVLIGWLAITRRSYQSYCVMLKQFVKQKFAARKKTSGNIIVTKERTYQVTKIISVQEWQHYQELHTMVVNAATERDVSEKKCAEFVLHSILPAVYFEQWFRKDQMIVQLLRTRYMGTMQIGEQIRILELLSLVPSEASFIKEQLLSKNPVISKMAVKCMKKHGISLDEKEKAVAKTWVQELIGHLLWYEACLADIENEQALTELSQTLKREKYALDLLMFDVLAFVYDPAAVAEVSEGLTDISSGDGKMLAHELLENFFDQEIREKINGLYVPQEIEGKLYALHDMYPQQRLPVPERLIDIMHKEYQWMPMYIKLLALEAIGYLKGEERNKVLLQSLQSIHPMLAATAANLLRREQPDAYEKGLHSLQLYQQKQLETIDPNWRQVLNETVEYSKLLPVPVALLPLLNHVHVSDTFPGGSVYCITHVDEPVLLNGKQVMEDMKENTFVLDLYKPDHQSLLFHASPAFSFFS